MNDPRNKTNGQPEAGVNKDLHLTNQDVSLVNSSDSTPETVPADERENEESARQEGIDRRASPEFDTDASYANL